MSRRDFLATSLAAASVLVLPGSRVLGANDDIRLGFIGVGGRGSHSVNWFHGQAGQRVVALCDVDREHLARTAAQCAERGLKPSTYSDPRELLDSPDVDAVVISTCNHTHSLIGIWACQAGKDVYVEKPVCQNVWEGMQLAAAARRHGRIVAGGFQNRSDVGLREFFPWLHEGNLGAVQQVRGLCYRNRDSIGKIDSPLTPPAEVDYNLWLGPAAEVPLYRPKFHYDWHWVWNTGNGDIGNQGVHEMDLMRWALGDPALPTRIDTFGGRFGWDDAGETPNLHYVDMDMGVPARFEVCDLKVSPDLNASPHYKGVRVGVVITCEGGEFRGGRGGGWVYDPNGERIRNFPGDGGEAHGRNFLDAVRARDPKILHSPIDEAFLSSALSHLGNIVYQTGSPYTRRTLPTLRDGEAQEDFLTRFTPLLEAWQVDPETAPWYAGSAATFDPEALRFSGAGADACNALVRRTERPGFEIPDIAGA
jgi:predicted dehydrogenase